MWNWIDKLAALRKTGKRFAIATVTNVAGSTPREVGAKMLVCDDGAFFGTIGGGKLEQLALEDALRAIDTGLSKSVKYPLCIRTGQCCGGSVDMFFEVVNNGPLLYLYGAGHVGQALCSVLDGTPFYIHLIDERSEWLETETLPKNVVRHKKCFEDFNAQAEWDEGRVYVAVMTHLHDLDLAIVADVVRRKNRFVGLIGSQTKWARFTQRLRAMELSDERIERITCPIGLKTGGKAPKEVAVSVAAQLLQLHYQNFSQPEDE